MRTRLDIMANKESMRAICRAVEIAQSMMLSHVVPHALFLALYETNRKEIEKFLSACGVRGRRQLPAYSPASTDPGLKSRFTKYISFPDYSAEELTRIFFTMLSAQGYTYSPGVPGLVRIRFGVLCWLCNSKYTKNDAFLPGEVRFTLG